MCMKRITSAEIFVNLFCRERFFAPTHMPFFMQHFAPPIFKRAMHEDMSRALLRRAALNPLADTSDQSDEVDIAALSGLSNAPTVDPEVAFKNHFMTDSSLIRPEHTKMSPQEAADKAASSIKGNIKDKRYTAGAGDRECVGEKLTAEKLKTDKLFAQNRYAVRYALEDDRARVVMSAPFRRLQQKTQVFPLDINASSRSRLTHSNEVAALARFTIYALAEHLKYLKPFISDMVTCVETAAYLHDIGNPPFGHFGEQVIRDWLYEEVKKHEGKLTSDESDDLRSFNGNAQGLRLAHTIQRLNISLGQMSACMKVPYTCKELREKGIPERKVHAHNGCFISEQEVLERIRESNLGSKRHPLSLIMEQCDDLAYVLADLEDAYDRKVLKDYEIFNLIDNLITFIKYNACTTTCDKCVSSCTCAHGDQNPFYGLTGELIASIKFAAPAADSDSDESNSKTDVSSDAASSAADAAANTDAKAADANSDTKAADANADSSAANTGAANADAAADVAASNVPSSATRDAAQASSAQSQDGDKAATQSTNGSAKSDKGDKSKVLDEESKKRKPSYGGCSFGDGDALDDQVHLDVVLTDMIKHAYCRMKNDSFGVLQLVHGNNPIPLTEMMSQLGVNALLTLFNECISTYYILDIVNTVKANERDFFDKGKLNITYYGNDAHKAVEFIRRFEKKTIYTDHEVMSLEMQGAACLKGILNAYAPLLKMSSSDFYKCMTSEEGDMYLCHLMQRLTRRCKQSYLETIKENKVSEMYARIRLIVDFVSGMTDTFAAHEFSILSGFRSPESIIQGSYA